MGTYKIKTKMFSMMIVVVALVVASMPTPLRRADFTPVAHAQFGNQFGLSNENDVAVKLQPRVDAKQFAQQNNLIAKQRIKGNIYLFEVPEGSLLTAGETAEALSRNRNVVWAERNLEVQLDQEGDDGDTGADQRSGAFIDQRSGAFIDGVSPSDFFQQYALQRIRAAEAHAYSTGLGITVAVIDTGVDISHPAVVPVLSGWDFVNNDGDAVDMGTGSAYGHGTHVAGIIRSVAPGVIILPVRAFRSSGWGWSSNIANAIYYAVDQGADVINMSFSMSFNSWLVREAIEYAAGMGVTMVAAAGNTGTSWYRYPAAYASVIGVAATNDTDHRADFSSYGAYVSVSAPGTSIYSAYPGGVWAWWDGTSFAAPMVSGQAALLRAMGRSTSLITSTAVPVPDSGMGSGRIDILASVQ